MIRVHPVMGEGTEIVQATIYVEERAESELAFGPSDTLERQIVHKVLEVGFACDVKERVVEICARDGKSVRDEYAASFARHFAPNTEAPIETPRRDVLLDTLRTNPEFQKEPADGIERVEVSSLDFFSTGGGFARIEKRGEEEPIYEFLQRKFGGLSPLTAGGWQLTGSTVRIVLAAKEGPHPDRHAAHAKHHDPAKQNRKGSPVRLRAVGTMESAQTSDSACRSS